MTAVTDGAAPARRGRGDRRHRRRVDPTRLGRRRRRRGARRVEPVLEALAGAPSRSTRRRPRSRAARSRSASSSSTTSPRCAPIQTSPASSPTAGAYLCLMHMLGEPRTMQDNPVYDDVVSDIKAFLEERLAFAVAEGVPEELDLPRSRDRLRQDRRAELRARPPARRAGRDRPTRCWSASRARARSGGSSATQTARTGRVAASIGAARQRLRARRYAPARARRPRARRGTRRRESGRRAMIVELRGLELYGYHGVDESEKRDGQPFLFDVWLDVGERGADDRIDHAVDYRDWSPRRSREVSAQRVDLLEALAYRDGRRADGRASSPAGSRCASASRRCGPPACTSSSAR